MNDLDLFCATGETLYGSQWANELARVLEINPRTVQRWAKGQSRIAPGIWLALVGLLDAKQNEMVGLRPRLLDRASTSTSTSE